MAGFTQEMRDKAQATRERKRQERAQTAIADAAKAAAPPEPEPEVMPSLDGGPVSVFEDEMPVSEVPVAGLDDPFERFLADLDDETRELLTEEDGSTPQLRAIFEAEVVKARAARRDVAKKQAAARASRHAKTDAGLISPKDAAAAAFERTMARKVTWTPEMARDANGNLIDEGYRIDGKEPLYDGIPHTGTYGEWLSYREMAWRARNHEMDFEGKGLLNAQRRLSTGALAVTLAGRTL